jgi:hypothetical protein
VATEVSSNAQFWLLVTGIVLVVVGLGEVGWQRVRVDRRMALVVGGITLLGLFLRLWQLNTSVRFFVDELAFSTAVEVTWREPNLEILAPMESIAAFPNLFAYWLSQGVMVFGRSFLGLRAAAAFLGALGVPAVYLLARTLFDRRVALMAALLLATFPPHLHFSRIAISEIAGPLFGTLALAFLARGMMGNRRAAYVLGGAMLGMTHYFHEGSRLIYTPLAVAWVVMVAVVWRPRVQVAHLVLAGAAALIVALPIYYTLVGMERSLAARMVDNNSALNGAYWRTLFAQGDFEAHVRQHVIPPFLMYIHQVENTLFYRGKTALVLTAAAPAFLLGLFYALWRWRMPGLLLVGLWWLSVTLGNTLMVDSAGSPRYVMVFPVLMVMVAVGVRYTLALLWPDTQTHSRSEKITAIQTKISRAQNVMLAAITIGLALVQTQYYFYQHLPVYNQQFRDVWPHRDAQDAVLRSLALPPGTQIHIVSPVEPDEVFTRGVLNFLSSDYKLDAMTTEEFTRAYVMGLDTTVNHAFYVEPRQVRVLELLRGHFDGLQPPQESPFDTPPEKQFLLYFAPRRASTSPATP